MPSNFTFTRWTFDENGDPVFGFGHTANLFHYNSKTQKIDSFKVSSLVIDTLNLHLYPERNTVPQLDYAIPEYLKLYYNNFNNQYARVLRLPDTTLISNPFDENFFKQHTASGTLIFFDSNFKTLGECLIPVGFSIDNIFFDKDGIWLWNREKSKHTKKVVLQKFKVSFEPVGKDDFRKEVTLELKRRQKK